MHKFAIGMLVASFSALAFSQLQSDYNSLPAANKLSFLSGKIVADTSSDSFMNSLKTLWKVSQSSYLWKMQDTSADWREAGHHKATHGVGAAAMAHFKWNQNRYTGMFQQADHCVLRMANAAPPGGAAMGSYGPNLAVKCLRDSTPSAGEAAYNSANLLFLWQLDGYAVIPEGKQKSCSYFEAPLANHCPLRDDIQMALKDLFVGSFNKVDPRSMLLGVSGFAEAGQNGIEVDKPDFPFALVLAPAPGLNDVACTFSEPISQLLGLKDAGFGKGSTLYDVYAVADPSPQPSVADPIQHIGSLVLDSEFTSSLYADTELFFQHRFFSQEESVLTKINPARAKAWKEYVDNKDNYKVEGANLYWPFLPKKDAEPVDVLV